MARTWVAAALSGAMAVGAGSCGGKATRTSSAGSSGGRGGDTGVSATGVIEGSNGGGTGGASETGPATVLEACPTLVDVVPCGATSFVAERRPLNLLWVVDRSGSMIESVMGQVQWNALGDAVLAAARALSDDARQGLLLYPSLPDGSAVPLACADEGSCCEMPRDGRLPVDVVAGVDAVPAIEAALEVEPGGGSPMAAALAEAYDYYVNGAGARLDGKKVVLLVSDGEANCNEELDCAVDECALGWCEPDPGASCVDRANVLAAVADLADERIDVVVLGSPDGEVEDDLLTEIESPLPLPYVEPYFKVYSAGDLVQYLGEFTVRLVDACEFNVMSSIYAQPTVAVDCKIIDRFGPGEGGAAGEVAQVEHWSWDGESQSLDFLGSSCAMLEHGAERVDVIFDCPGFD